MQGVEAAKASSYIPTTFKSKLEDGVIVAEKLTPFLEKYDTKLGSAVVTPLNGRIETVTSIVQPVVQKGRESYSEGGLRQMASDVYTEVDSKVVHPCLVAVEPVKESIKSAYGEGGLRQVVSDVAVPTFVDSKRRINDAVESAAKKNKKLEAVLVKLQGVKEYGVERTQEIVHFSLIDYAEAMDSKKILSLRDAYENSFQLTHQLTEKATTISKQGVKYMQENDLNTIKSDLVHLGCEAQKIGSEKFSASVEQLKEALAHQQELLLEKKGELKEKMIAVPDDLRVLAGKVVVGLEGVGAKLLGEERCNAITARFGRVFGLPTPLMMEMSVAVSEPTEEDSQHTPMPPSESMTSMVSEVSSEGYGQEDPHEEYFEADDSATSLKISPNGDGSGVKVDLDLN